MAAVELLDRVLYTCRAAGGQIQDTVNWEPDPSEFEAVTEIKISVQFPAHHPRRGEWVQLQRFDNSAGLPPETFPIRCSLADYFEVDELRVKIEARYSIRPDGFQAHPTRNFDFFVNFPAGFKVQVKPLVLHPELCYTAIENTFARVQYDSWMLPQSGVAWGLWPGEQTSHSPNDDVV